MKKKIIEEIKKNEKVACILLKEGKKLIRKDRMEQNKIKEKKRRAKNEWEGSKEMKGRNMKMERNEFD
jgi:hypothetical protein